MSSNKNIGKEKEQRSILKGQKRHDGNTSSSSRRNVTFSSGGDENSMKHKHIMSKHPKNDITNITQRMDDDEEDAFDPTIISTNNRNLNNANNDLNFQQHDAQRIREVKSARALQRVTGKDNNIFDDDAKTTQQKIGSYGSNTGGDHFEGEEDVDKHYSLLHDTILDSDQQCPIEPFNLKSEREDGEGYFDGDTYVFRNRSRKTDEDEDAWLDDLNNQDGYSNNNEEETNSSYSNYSSKNMMPPIEKKKKEENTVGIIYDTLTKEQIYQQFVPLLAHDNETVLKALTRYGNIVKQETKKMKKNQRLGNSTQKMDQTELLHNISNNHQDDHCMSAAKQALNKITELCDVCMMKFDDGGNIYEYDKKFFLSNSSTADDPVHSSGNSKRKQSSYFSETTTNDDVISSSNKKLRLDDEKATVLWEYKGNQDNAIHGPYTTQQMLDWTSAGYFVGEMTVDIRIVGDTHGNASQNESKGVHETTVNDLLDDLEDSDGEDEKEAAIKSSNSWMRSDKIDFRSYL